MKLGHKYLLLQYLWTQVLTSGVANLYTTKRYHQSLNTFTRRKKTKEEEEKCHWLHSLVKSILERSAICISLWLSMDGVKQCYLCAWQRLQLQRLLGSRVDSQSSGRKRFISGTNFSLLVESLQRIRCRHGRYLRPWHKLKHRVPETTKQPNSYACPFFRSCGKGTLLGNAALKDLAQV